MNTSKEQNVVNNTLMDVQWALMYYLHMDYNAINNLLNCKSNLKNYWLQKKEFKVREAKIEKIAKFVTKYISDRKQ